MSSNSELSNVNVSIPVITMEDKNYFNEKTKSGADFSVSSLYKTIMLKVKSSILSKDDIRLILNDVKKDSKRKADLYSQFSVNMMSNLRILSVLGIGGGALLGVAGVVTIIAMVIIGGPTLIVLGATFMTFSMSFALLLLLSSICGVVYISKDLAELPEGPQLVALEKAYKDRAGDADNLWIQVNGIQGNQIELKVQEPKKDDQVNE